MLKFLGSSSVVGVVKVELFLPALIN